MTKSTFDGLKGQDVEHFPTLRNWQNDSLVSMAASLLELISVLWDPFVCAFQCGPIVLTFLLLQTSRRAPAGPIPWIGSPSPPAEPTSRAKKRPTRPSSRTRPALRRGTTGTAAIAARRRHPHRLDFLRWYVHRMDRLCLTEIAALKSDDQGVASRDGPR